MVTQTFLVDTYLMYAASALAGHTMIHSATGAAFPLFGIIAEAWRVRVSYGCSIMRGGTRAGSPMVDSGT